MRIVVVIIQCYKYRGSMKEGYFYSRQVSLKGRCERELWSLCRLEIPFCLIKFQLVL